MDYNIVNEIIICIIPLAFIGVGGYVFYKTGKKLYRSQFAIMKVTARCVEVQKLQEEGEKLYRPVYEYELNGRYIRATSLDYKYENSIPVGTAVSIYVEKKHPEVVAPAPDNMVAVIVSLVISGYFLFNGLMSLLTTLGMILLGRV